jgi:hypothetical protein
MQISTYTARWPDMAAHTSCKIWTVEGRSEYVWQKVWQPNGPLEAIDAIVIIAEWQLAAALEFQKQGWEPAASGSSSRPARF